MGDQIDTFRDMKEFNREETKARHQEWFKENIDILRASGLRFAPRPLGLGRDEQPTTLLFREPGKPRVDFYPHTGRWRVVGGRDLARGGGAHKFLDWYAKQRLCPSDGTEIGRKTCDCKKDHDRS